MDARHNLTVLDPGEKLGSNLVGGWLLRDQGETMQEGMTAAGRRIEVSTRFRGELLQPGDAGYDSARTTFNRRFQGQPAAIARCLGVTAAVTALALAREHGLEVSVRGGGHSVGGWSTNDGGLVIDLTRMRPGGAQPRGRAAPGGRGGPCPRG